ncbi:DUF4073 domain-containing protein [Cytobacillus sp. FJAT-53684]|uniref:DUF4073 domain-containing protein n=1 Tax=Cytobacillus mangrovibacter TaxID=3299024 RepID=A0ABW6K1W0_9BACI
MRKRKLSFKVMVWLSLVCMLVYMIEPFSSLYVSSKVYAAATPRSENFESVPTGSGVSVPQTIGDWTFSMVSTVGASPRTQIRMLAPNTTKDLLFLGSFQAGVNEYGRVQSNTGAFKLVSFRVVERNSTADTYRIVGYLGGNPVVGAEKSFTPPFNNFYTVDVSSDPAWQNIDEFRIYANATVKLDFDDLIVTDPVIADSTAPTVGNTGTITTNNVTASEVTLDWTEATDNVTSQEDLEYRVYQSSSNNIDTVSDIEANGTPLGNGFTKDISSFGLTELDADTTYYFNVIVKDAAGNKSAYKMQQVNTVNVVPGVTVTIGNVTAGKGLTEEIPVSINTPITGIGGYGIQINYDPSIIDILEIIPTDASDEELFFSNIESEEGWFKVGWADITGGDSLISTAKELFKVKVKAKSDAPLGSSALAIDKTISGSIDFSDNSYPTKAIPADAVNGTIQVVNSYNVDFDVSGGTPIGSQLIKEDGKAIKPADPTKGDYTFAGWYTSNTYTTEFDFNTAISSDITLFAKWIGGSTAPTVLTDLTVSNVSSTSATVSGEVTSDGNSPITERGIAYSTNNSYPTIEQHTKKVVTGTVGPLTANLTGLKGYTTYYYRPYATNANGTSYGMTNSFTTKSNDANIYNLNLSIGSLSDFHYSIVNYGMNVPSSTENLIVTPTSVGRQATFTVNDRSASEAIALAPGKNTIEIKVIAEDGTTTKTYTINVYRLAPAPNVAADDERNIIEGINVLLEYQIDDGLWEQYNPLTPPDLRGNKVVKVRIPGSVLTGVPSSEEAVLYFTKDLSQPTVTNTVTEEDTQSGNGLVITPNSEDATVTHFRISDIIGGTLYKNDGTTPIGDGDYITKAEGFSGLKFSPAPNANSLAGDTFSFKIQASLDEAGRGLSEAEIAAITVNEVNDSPIAGDDNLPGKEMNPQGVEITFAELLANDKPGPDNESAQILTIKSVDHAVGGTVAIQDGKIKFIPSDLGTVSFDYTVEDNGTSHSVNDFKSHQATVSFKVVDTKKPIITLEGSETIYLVKDQSYLDPGYTVFDEVDQDLTQDVDVTGSVDTSQLGTYHVKYNVSDRSNNAADEVTRTIHVVSPELNALAVSTGELTPLFTPEQLNYHVTVPYNVTNVDITASLLDPSASITINGTLIENDISQSIPLVDGNNPVTIVVTAKGGSTQTYTIEITKSIAPPAAPNVSAEDTTNKLVGADGTMEFSTDDGETWTTFDLNHSPTFTGDVTVKVRVKATGNKSAGESTTVTFTLNPAPPSSGGGSSTPDPTPVPEPTPDPKPTTEQIVVDVDGNDGTNLTKTPIERTTEPNGTVKDKVSMSDSIAKDTVAKAKEKGMDTARIVIPDKEDKVSEVRVEIPNTALKQLNDGNLNLEIVTENGVISIPTTSISSFNDDLYFRVVPIKSEEGKKQVENRAKTEELVKEVAKDQTVQVLGRPMEIETNMQSREVSIVLPLRDLPADASKQQEILDNLGVFIEHSDGTKELIPGQVVKMKDGTQGLQFTVTKFSTFTMIYMDGWEEFQAGQKDLHTPYIQGSGNGSFSPNANVSRAQMAAMLARNLDRAPTTKLPNYQDVIGKHWAYADIMEAKNAGIMLGVSNTKFDPEGSVTRAQMAAIAYRWIQSECKNDSSSFDSCVKLGDSTKSSYKDVSAKHWASEAIYFLKESDIMIGNEDGNFHPEDKLSRAQAVKVLNRLFRRGPMTGVTTPTFEDVSKKHWAFEEIEEAAREHQVNFSESGKEVLKK